MYKVGDKASMLPPDFTFSVICITEEQSLDIDLTHRLPNHTLLDIGYGPLISRPPTNQLTSQVKINLQQSAPSSHEHAELQALQLGNHKNVWS